MSEKEPTISADLLKVETEPVVNVRTRPAKLGPNETTLTPEAEIRQLETVASAHSPFEFTANAVTYVNVAFTPKQVSYLLGVCQSHTTSTAEEIVVKLLSARAK